MLKPGFCRRADDDGFAAGYLACGFRHLLRHLPGHDHGTVLVGMNEIAVRHRHAGHRDRAGEVHYMDVGMGWPHAVGQHLEAFGDVREVAHAAVGDDSLGSPNPCERLLLTSPQKEP